MRKLFLIFAAAIILPAGSVSAEPAPEIEHGLDRLNDVIMLPMIRDERMLEASSYDRTGGNDDGFAGTYSTIREENGEFVFFEDDGPGVLYRLWTASYGGNIGVYFDGAPEPAYSAPITDFLGGDVDPLAPPLCQFAAGGLCCYFPLEYQKSIKLTLDQKPLFFQATYSDTAPGVKSSTPENLAGRPEIIEAAIELLENRGDPPFPPSDTSERDSFSSSLEPGVETPLWEAAGRGIVREIYFDTSGVDARTLKNIVLRLYWDGEETPAVEASLLRFFALDFTVKNFRSLFVGHGDDRFYCYFPMPYRKGARMTAELSADSAARLSGALVFDPAAEVPGGFAYFHAANRRVVTVEHEPVLINDISGGPGHWVGTAVSMLRRSGEDDDFTYLEGDETIYIDGEDAPVQHGTGTEDYFNGAWYFQNGDEFHRSFFGAPIISKNRSRCVLYRIHYTDAVAFKNSIRFELEHGSTDSRPGILYDTVSYWYQEPASKTGL